MIQPGDYVVPFVFDVPNNAPASIRLDKIDGWVNPKAKITYRLTCEFQPSGGVLLPFMFTRQLIV